MSLFSILSLFRYVALLICRTFKQAIFCRSLETAPDLSLFRYVALRYAALLILSRNGVVQNHQASQRPPAPLLLFPLCPRESTSVVFRGLAYSGLRED